MYRPKPIPPIRLTKLATVPSYNDVLAVFNQTKHAIGKRIELPFTLENGVNYLLVAVAQPEGGDPTWMLYLGATQKAPVIFSDATGDLQFLVTLIKGECWFEFAG